jgi:TFIIF-interacting CTD phosphatase-like protein
VWFQEAERLEKETAERLTKERKLSLIVDLDQTVLHATCDPRVPEIAKSEFGADDPLLQVRIIHACRLHQNQMR